MIVGTPTKLNLIPSGVMPVVYINQGDAGYDKEFLIYNGDSPYNVPSGVSATIRGTKADGYGVTEAATVTTGSNLVTATITEQMVAAAGKNIYELVFVDTNGLRVASINMVWAVKKDALGDSVISDSDLDYVSQAMDRIQGADAMRSQMNANTAAISAETAARIAADNTLQTNINNEATTRASYDNTLQAQIDQLVAPTGSAPSAAEVENARVSVDGIRYDTLGNAIRGQVSDLKSALNVLDFFDYGDDDLTDNGYLSLTNGTILTDASGFHHSKLIRIPDGASSVKLLKSGNISGGAVVAFYTGYKFSSTTFISGVNCPDSSALPADITIPSNAHYVAFSNRTTANFEVHLNASEICNYVTSVKDGYNFGLQAGSIGVDGTISYGSTSISNYISDIISRNDFESIEITPNEGYLCNVAYFNNGAFVSRGSWVYSTSKLVIDNTYDCILMFATEASSSKTASQMLEEYDIQMFTIPQVQALYELSQTHNNSYRFRENIASSISCGKVIHYSLDDSYRALRRLITEKDVYTSIFDNYIFALLKDVHDTTGACFTMNVINVIYDFDITNVPNKFAAEFQANKSWLKFAWHGLWNTVSYDCFATLYATFVNSVYYFTGTYDCIDRITRTESFYGTKRAIQALKDNANASIIGFLTADDTRTSYYLSADQNAIAINKGKYFDFENQTVFIRSASRLDNVSASQLIAEIEANPCYQNFVEVWYHEGLTGEPMRQTLKDIGAWASANGYNNYYPSKVFK